MAGWRLWVQFWLLSCLLGPSPAWCTGHRGAYLSVGGLLCGCCGLGGESSYRCTGMCPLGSCEGWGGGTLSPIKATEMSKGLFILLPFFSTASLTKSRSPWGKGGQHPPRALAESSLLTSSGFLRQTLLSGRKD